MERKKSFFNLLQFKIHLGIQFILAACFFALVYFIYVTQLNFLISDIERQGAQQAAMVADSSVPAIQRGSFFLLEDLATKVEYSPLVAYCQILDAQGKSFLKGEVQSGLTRDELMAAYSVQDVVVVTKDITLGAQRIGQVKMGMFIDKARQEVKKTTVQLVAAFAAVLGVIAVFLYIFLNQLLILPVVNLSVLTETLSRGEFVTTNLDRRKDELGVLAHGFNNMSHNLKELYKNLEKKVDARTEELNIAYNEMQAVFDNSLVGIAVFSPDHRVLRANTRFAMIFGYDSEEILHVKPHKMHISSQEMEEFSDKFFARLTEKEIIQQEYQFRKKDGTVFWSQVSAKAIDQKDLNRGIILVLEDISDRKRATELLRQHAEDLNVAKEEADKATRSKSEFLARMSHEIRTPMNAILGMAEMLQETGLNEEQQEYVSTFSSAGELLLGIINDILDFSKIEVGQIRLESIPFNLRDLIEDVAKLFLYRAEEKSIRLDQHVSPGLPQRYLGDPTRIRQILINLLGNAIKFTSKGGATLSVTESVMDDGSPCCLFAVKDTGIGIPKAKLNAVFESFAQADSSTTREFGGTGLGLAISKKLVELMGGIIWVESEINQGTTFCFKLPLTPDLKVQAAPFALKLPLDSRLLVLEDSPAAEGSVTELMRSWGMDPISCTSVVEALERINASQPGQSFQSIVIDTPVENAPGIEAIHALISQGVPAASLVVIVSSVDELSLLSEIDLDAFSYILRDDRDTHLHDKICEVVSEAQRRRMTDFQEKAWKILLVDDVEANRRVVELFLKSSNVSLVHAENGQIALDKFMSEPFDIVLMDMEMPVMDGLEATRRIRSWEQETRDYRTPIVALTAHAFQEYRHRVLEAGCSEFLAKPIKKQALIKMIDLFAGRKEPLTPVPVVATTDKHLVTPPDKDYDSPVQIDPELEDLRPLFLRTVRDFQSQLVDALAANDFMTMQRCGHSLKGLGSTYAVDEISQAGRAIEIAAKGKQATVVTEAVNHLNIFMDTGQSPKILLADLDKDYVEAVVETDASTDRYVVHVAPEMSELIPFLMDAMEKDLELMNKALAQNDYPGLRRFGHSHKGFGTTYGFDFISRIGLKIQKAADARDHDKLVELVESLDNFLKRVDIVYDVGDASSYDGAQPSSLSAKEQIVMVDSELYELIPLFMDTMRANIAEMRDALEEHNFDLICQHGHRQKGLGSTYGFDFIGNLGSKVETAGMQKDVEKVESLLEDLSRYLDNVRIVEQK